MELINVMRNEGGDRKEVLLNATFENSLRQGNILQYELFYGSLLDLSTDLILEIYEY